MRQFGFHIVRVTHGLHNFFLNAFTVAFSHAVDLQAQRAFGDAKTAGGFGIRRGVVAEGEEFAELVEGIEVIGLFEVLAQFFLGSAEKACGPGAVKEGFVGKVRGLVLVAILGLGRRARGWQRGNLRVFRRGDAADGC